MVGANTGCPPSASDRTVTPAEVVAAVLLPLADFGGLAPTHALQFVEANPPLDIGGSCAATDQRGFASPADGPDAGSDPACDAGSVEAAAAVTASVSLSPALDPVVVPVSGGAFTYAVTVTNTSQLPQTFDYWSRAVRPDGSASGTLFRPVRFTLSPGASVTRTLTQRLVGRPGLYRYAFFAGGFSTQTVNGADSIAVSKAGTG